LKIAITGGNGYVGKHLIDKVLSLNFTVTELSRAFPYKNINKWKKYDLHSPNLPSIDDDTKALIHLATTNFTIAQSKYYKNELESTKRLIALCRSKKIKFIFISSQSSSKLSVTEYGRTKNLIEKYVIESKGIVLRVGLIYGGSREGLFGTLINFLKKTPFFPIFIPSPKIQPIHIEDLIDIIIQCITQKKKSKIYFVGSVKEIDFNEFLFMIKKYLSQKKHIPIFIPSYLLLAIYKIFGSEFSKKIYIDRFVSLFLLEKMATTKDLKYFGVCLRSLCNGFQKENSKKHLIRKEGFILLAYLLKKKPTHSLVKRYLNYMSHQNKIFPINFKQVALKYPILISLLDDNLAHNVLLNKKINAASLIAEASIAGSQRYLFCNSSLIRSFFIICNSIFFEIFFRIIRLINLINKKLLTRLLIHENTF